MIKNMALVQEVAATKMATAAPTATGPIMGTIFKTPAKSPKETAYLIFKT